MRKKTVKRVPVSFTLLPKVALLFSILTVFTLNVQAQWQWLNPKPSGYADTRIVFPSHDTGYILNANGDLFKTSNRGDSWEPFTHFAESPLCMDIQHSTGVIGCSGGMLYLSGDNGNNWQLVNTGINDNFETINIVSQDTFFLSCGYDYAHGYGNIYETTDRGKTWITLHCDIPIHSIVFPDSKTGYIGSTQGTIIKTEDGGVSWERKRAESIIPSGIQAMQFLDRDTGFDFEETNTLLATYDGGNTWRSSNTYSTTEVIDFINSNDGYLAGEDGALVATHDGGKTFEPAAFDTREGNSIFSLCFLSKDTGFSAGLLGRIMKTTDAGKTWTSYSPTYLPVTNLVFIDSVHSYAMTSRSIYKTSDKWKTWDLLPLTTGVQYASQSNFEQFHFSSPDTGFVTTSFPPRIHHTDDGGKTWDTASITPGDLDWISNLQFTDRETGFMSIVTSSGGGKGYMVKTENGGSTWNTVASATDVNIFKHIKYLNKDTAYANSYYQLYRTTDGGKTWTIVFTTDYFYELTDFDFTSTHRGFVADGNGDIVITNDGGITWSGIRLSDFTNIVNGEIRAIKFFNPQIGYITTQEGVGPANYGDTYQTIDSGRTWQKSKNVGGNSILFTKDTSVVVYGYGGMIMATKINSIHVDSIKQLNNCSNVLSAVVTSVLSRADSISFEITDANGKTVSVAAMPSAVENARVHCTAPAVFFKNGSSYSVRLKYLNRGNYVVSPAVRLTAIGLSVPTISKAGNTLTSNYPGGNQWFRNDTLIDGATLQAYTLPEIQYAQCYRVVETNGSGCSSSSDSLCFEPARSRLRITGTYSQDEVLLSWTINDEVNIDHFEIEKSANGTDYVTIDNVRPVGNSPAAEKYNYSDRVTPDHNERDNYYIVKEIYTDGSFRFSNSVMVKIAARDEVLIAAPNPTTGNTVLYFPRTITNAVIGIFDEFGRKVFVQKLTTPQDDYPLNLTGYKAGIYSIKVDTDKGKYQLKIVLIK